MITRAVVNVDKLEALSDAVKALSKEVSNHRPEIPIEVLKGLANVYLATGNLLAEAGTGVEIVE